jgi:cyclopropane-fatty-acyl-phospholipid synthase
MASETPWQSTAPQPLTADEATFLCWPFLLANNPLNRWLSLMGYVFFGALFWTPIEYVLHRFVLHGLPTFKTWHQLHHDRPFALIYTPTQFIVVAFLVLVYMPLWVLPSTWIAVALTLGLIGGYLLYSTAHHAMHHWATWNPVTAMIGRMLGIYTG